MNEYSRLLVDQGVDVTVIAARHSRRVPAFEVVNGVSVHRILSDSRTAIGFKPTIFGYRALKKLDALCQNHSIDLLHLLSFANLGAILAPVPWLQAPPNVVADTRGTAVRNAAFDYFSRKVIQLQDRLVDRSIMISERVGHNVLGADASFDVVPLGVDMSRFSPGRNHDFRSSWDIPSDGLVIGYTGSLHKPRRIDRLIDVFAEVQGTYESVRLVIVGDGTHRDYLETYARKTRCSEAIHFTGEIPHDKVPRYLRAFDIGFAYVPDVRQYRDQPPLKTAEFLATGLPILASDTPGNRFFVTENTNALVVRDNHQAYVEGLKRLLNSSSLRERLASEARESVREYDYESIVQTRLIPVYDRVISES